jgi:hypothetical protein
LPAHCWPTAINQEPPAGCADLAEESIFFLFSIACLQAAGLAALPGTALAPSVSEQMLKL